jgi:hypothetical protein
MEKNSFGKRDRELHDYLQDFRVPNLEECYTEDPTLREMDQIVGEFPNPVDMRERDDGPHFQGARNPIEVGPSLLEVSFGEEGAKNVGWIDDVPSDSWYSKSRKNS